MDDIIWPPRSPAGAKSKPKSVKAPEPKPAPEPAEEEQTERFPGMEQDPPEQPQEQPEEQQALTKETEVITNKAAPPPKPSRKRFYFRHIRLSKQQWALVAVVIVVLLIGGGLGARALYRHFRKPVPQPAQAKVVKKIEPPKPTTEPSQLTGVQVDPALNKRPVTGIMIENSPDARPQSGLKDAGIVYEAIAEGGITRFLALFQEAQPDYIGPVRSVRPYYLDFLMPFDAPIAHIGGAPQALSDIKSFGVKDLDQFFNSGGYWRISERFAPHNVYTSFAKIDAMNAAKGWGGATFTSFPRKSAAPLPTPTASSIDLSISGPLYNVHYDYDKAANSYKRSEAGAAHKDDKSGAQLAPNVVIALVVSRGIASDGQHTNYNLIGSEHMFVFQDGFKVEGTWSKAGRKDQFVFTGENGKPLALNPGQTWITLVDNSGSVTFK